MLERRGIISRLRGLEAPPRARRRARAGARRRPRPATRSPVVTTVALSRSELRVGSPGTSHGIARTGGYIHVKKRWLTLAIACGSSRSLRRSRVAVSRGSAASAAHKAQLSDACLVTDIGGLNDQSFNHLAYDGLQQAQKTRRQGPRHPVEVGQPTTSRTCRRAPQSGATSSIGVGFLMADAIGRRRDSSSRRSSSRSSTSTSPTLKHKPKNVAACSSGAGGRLPRRLLGRPDGEAKGGRRSSARSAASRSRRSTATSPATSTARRRPTRGSSR